MTEVPHDKDIPHAQKCVSRNTRQEEMVGHSFPHGGIHAAPTTTNGLYTSQPRGIVVDDALALSVLSLTSCRCCCDSEERHKTAAEAENIPTTGTRISITHDRLVSLCTHPGARTTRSSSFVPLGCDHLRHLRRGTV